MNNLQNLVERWGGLPKQQRLLIAFGTPVVVFAVFYFLILSGVEGSLQETTQNISKERRTQGDLEVEIRNQHVLEQEFKFKQAKVREIERKIPMEADPGDLLDKVYEQAGVSRLDLRTFKPESELRVKEMAFIINRGDFSGTYHAVGEFLDRIGHLERLVKVLAIQFKVNQNAKSKDGSLIANQLVGTATIAAFRLLRDDELESLSKKKKRRGRRR
ncbi:MAG: type 4a pilus biogenesis protein PilO [Myxococcota bacterium]|nr:type 4a pilus biogenesis protein PilO [Myxococcota bacterium]